MSQARLERLRAARLHRQVAPDLDALIGEQLGLHSTDYATPYLSAWARLPAFDPAALFDRLNRGDGLVRVNAFRNTVHVVRTVDLPLVSAATGAGVAAAGRRSPALKAVPDDGIRAGVDTIVAALADGPLSTNELKAKLPTLARDLRFWILVALGSGEVIRADAATPAATAPAGRSRGSGSRASSRARSRPPTPAGSCSGARSRRSAR